MRQAVKCLVGLAVHMARDEEREGGAARYANGSANGHGKATAAGPDGGAAARVGAAEDAEEDGEASEDEPGEGESEEAGQESEEGGAEGEEDGQGEPQERDGAVAADVEADDDDADDSAPMSEQEAARAFTLHGLVRRMSRLADDGRWSQVRQRCAALRWVAAAGSALGAAGLAPHLTVLLRPLYRISEAAAARGGGQRVPEEVRALAEEVMAHLRGLVGAEPLLAAYNAAREAVRGARHRRRREAAVRGQVDPAAAAAAKRRHGERKMEGRKRRLEVLKRERSAGGGGRQRGRGRGGGGKRPRQ